MPENVNLNGRRMHVVSTDQIGEVGIDTIFEFEQNGNIVSARYAGGKIRIGYLVGIINRNNLEFRYAQANIEDHLDGGQSNCEIKIADDGKLQLIEHFQWSSREGSGTNVFEEL